MTRLYEFYSLIKQEFIDTIYLKTCKELYENSKYRSQISSVLKDLGFKCRPEMESTLFFALVDIVVVVDSSNKFYYATLNNDKLYDLKKQGRIVPRKDDLDFRKASFLVNSNTLSKINEYLSKGKFHFIKLNNLDCDSFVCNISSMNPYPSITNERVFTLDFIAKTYWDILNYLVRDVYSIGDLICTAQPSSIGGRIFNNCPASCKFNVKTLEGILEELYIWDISSMNLYSESENFKKLHNGVCKIGDTYVTLSREVLERFYGSSYLDFESQGVRERYCLEELFGTPISADLRYYINKYRFYRDSEICACKGVHDLRRLLHSRMKPLERGSNRVSARVLVSPRALYSKHKSYYRIVSLDKPLEVVDDLESIMPQTYKVSGVSSLGYCSIEVKAISFGNAESNGKDEFIRQYGNLYSDKISGIQKGSEVCKGKHPVFDISIDTQRRICEQIRWGYKQNYDSYSILIRGIIDTLKLDIDVSDDMIKLLFINPIAKEVGKCSNVTLEILGNNLDKFLTLLTKSTQEELERKLVNTRKSINKSK